MKKTGKKGKRKTSLHKARRNEELMGYAFQLPLIILLCIFMIYPLFRTIYWSFTDFRGLGSANWVGLKNYISLFDDLRFTNAFKNTVVYSLGTTVLSCGLGLLLAAPIYRKIRGWNIYRFVFYITPMLSGTVVALLMGRLFNQDVGAINVTLRNLGLDSLALNWLTDLDIVMYTVILVSAWFGAGGAMLVYLSNMSAISNDVQEAATLDGVSEWQRFWHITFPIIKRPFLVVLMSNFIANFRSYEMINVLTGGGPGTKTQVLSILMTLTAFNTNQYGLACTYAVVIVVVIAILTAFYIKVSGIATKRV